MATFEEKLAAAREKKRLEAEGQAQAPAPDSSGMSFEEKLATARKQRGVVAPEQDSGIPLGAVGFLADKLSDADTRRQVKQSGMDLAAGLNTAAIDLLELPKTLYNAAVQSVGLGDLTVEKGFRDVPFIDRATRRQVPEEDRTPLQDMARTATEWGAGGLVTKGSKVPDIVSGVGAALGEQIGGETGEMVGGVTGLFAGRPKAPKPQGSVVDKDVRQFILDNAENPQLAISNLESAIATGEKGNLAELTRDQGIFNVQKYAVIKGSPTATRMNEIAGERNQQILDESAGVFGGGDASAAPTIAATRQAQLQGQASQRNRQQLAEETQQIQSDPQFEPVLPQATERLNKARAAEEVATGRVATDMKPSQASTNLAQAYNAEEMAFKQDYVVPAWNRFSASGNVSTADFNNVVKRELDSLNQTEANMLTQKFGAPISLLRGFGDEVAPDEIHTVLSQMKAINRNARNNNDYDEANRLLDKTINAMESGLRELGDKGAYDEAVRLSTEQFKRFQPTRVGEARGLREDATLGARMMATDEAGFEIGRLINNSGSPAIRAEAQQYIRSVADTKNINDTFLARYDELLDAFPELKNDLTRAKLAQDELASASKFVDEAVKADAKSATALTKAVEKAQTDAGARKKGLTKSISNLQLSQFKSNPAQYLDKALSGGTDTLDKLNRQMGRVEGGTEALRSAVRDRFVASLQNNMGTVTPTKVAEFNANKRNLISSGILTRDEVVEIENILERVNVSGMTKTAGVRKTEQADEVIADVLSSAAAIAALGVLPASNQLMLGNTIRRLFRGQLVGNAKHQARVLSALDDVILNPEKFLRGVSQRKIVTEEQLRDYIVTYINGVSQSVSEDTENE